MKDKLKNKLEHEVELLGRSISVLAIAGLLVVGGASAALLSSFGTVSGEADVEQAVYLEDSEGDSVTGAGASITASYDTSGDSQDSFVAGAAYNDEFSVVNNAGETVQTQFSRTGGEEADVGTNPSTQIVQEVYNASQEFSAYPQKDTTSDNMDIEVTPYVDSVEYVLYVDDIDYADQENVDLQVSTEEGENYHVKYFPGSSETDEDNWGIKFSDDSEATPLTDYEGDEVISADAVDNGGDDSPERLEIEVSRNVGYSQSFGVNAYSESENQFFKTENDDETTFYYSSEESYTTPTYNLIDQDFELETDGEDFVLGTYFPISTTPSTSYNFGVQLDTTN